MRRDNVNLYWCVMQADGGFCHWSLAQTRQQSWRAFVQGLNSTWTKERARKEGCRCVKMRLTRVKEGGGE